MNLLSLDTSTEFLSLAIQAGDTLFTHHQHAGNASSELILPQIQALLDAANIQLKDLHGIAFGAGPGAFTGVRIACGVAQGLGFGANIPVVGVNTLLAVAQASGANKVIVCLDARMGEIYHAAFEKIKTSEKHKSEMAKNSRDSSMQARSCTDIGFWTSAIDTQEKQWVGAGSGWGVYGDILSRNLRCNICAKHYLMSHQQPKRFCNWLALFLKLVKQSQLVKLHRFTSAIVWR